MCLVLVALNHHADYPLVIIANRDEFHGRPSAPLEFWREHPDVLAGRDIEKGGTWLGLTRSGRFAAVTNYRDGPATPGRQSRGELSAAWLLGDTSVEQYLRSIEPGSYAPFNLLFGHLSGPLVWFSGQTVGHRPLDRGVHGISNGHLNEPWPKVRRTRSGLRQALLGPAVQVGSLFEILADRRPAAPGDLPDTGVGPEMERALSPPFIVGPQYGTRSSTVVLLDRAGHCQVVERRFGPSGAVCGESGESFSLRQRD